MVKDLYLKYVLTVVAEFQPKFLLLGIEMGFPVIKAESVVDDYLELHKHVYTEVKKLHPDVLMTFANSPYVHMTAKSDGGIWGDKLFEINRDFSDFLGVSYYPHSSQFFETVFLTDPLPDGSSSDSRVLDEMKAYTKTLGGKRVAILDTGIPSQTVDLEPYFPIQIQCSPERINEWTDMVTSRAVADEYLLLNWWNAYDFEPLFDKQPGDETDPDDALGEAKAVLGIWKNMGLWEIPADYDTSLTPQPKAALSIWRQNLGISQTQQ